ncbi:hypothetical protein IMZ48_40790 [Candidatus Bathyarchaeota archaeon]|nr:hypothetical protein [Candidatus Bathyarchaeota archaeon]
MASIALRRLAAARPTTARLTPSLLPTTLTSSFSTGPTLLATASSSSKGKHVVGGKRKKNYKNSGKTSQAGAKAKTPGPGERKAFRKRIQLSNNNAIPVALGDLSAESMTAEESRGSVMGIPDKVVDQLRTVEAFRPGQSWGLFRRPHVLVRTEAVEVARMMDAAKEGKTTLKMVLSGARATGKSTMLLSAMAHAFLNDWVVVHIPEGASHSLHTFPPTQ